MPSSAKSPCRVPAAFTNRLAEWLLFKPPSHKQMEMTELYAASQLGRLSAPIDLRMYNCKSCHLIGCLLVAFCLLGCSLSLHAQTAKSNLDIQIDEFSSNQTSSLDQLIELGKQFHIPLGIEWHYRVDERPAPPIHLRGVTLHQALARILSPQADYNIENTQGVVHIYDKSLVNDPANFLNLRLPEFTLIDENLYGFTFLLRISLKQLLHPTPGYGGGYGYGPGRADGFDALKVTIKRKNVSAREVLNEAIEKQGNALWIVTLHTEKKMPGALYYGQGDGDLRTQPTTEDFHWELRALDDQWMEKGRH